MILYLQYWKSMYPNIWLLPLLCTFKQTKMAQVTRTDTDRKAVVASIPTDHRRHVRTTRSTRTEPLTMVGVLSTTRHLRQPWEETPCSLVRWLEISALIGGSSSPDSSGIEQKRMIFILLFLIQGWVDPCRRPLLAWQCCWSVSWHAGDQGSDKKRRGTLHLQGHWPTRKRHVPGPWKSSFFHF